MRNTREVVKYLSEKYVSGKTVDYGAGSTKYRNLIGSRATEYVAFDMVMGEHIDVVGDALNAPFEDEVFDTVISTQMLEHVEKPWVAVSEMYRVLKPGGMCLVTAPFLVPYHADPYDFFRFTQEGMMSILKSAGFDVVESGGYGNTPVILAEMIHFSHFSHYEKRPRWGKRFRDTFMNMTQGFAYRLDGIFKNRAMYANVFAAARKPVA